MHFELMSQELNFREQQTDYSYRIPLLVLIEIIQKEYGSSKFSGKVDYERGNFKRRKKERENEKQEGKKKQKQKVGRDGKTENNSTEKLKKP